MLNEFGSVPTYLRVEFGMGNEQSEKQLEFGIIGFPIQKFNGINAVNEILELNMIRYLPIKYSDAWRRNVI